MFDIFFQQKNKIFFILILLFPQFYTYSQVINQNSDIVLAVKITKKRKSEGEINLKSSNSNCRYTLYGTNSLKRLNKRFAKDIISSGNHTLESTITFNNAPSIQKNIYLQALLKCSSSESESNIISISKRKSSRVTKGKKNTFLSFLKKDQITSRITIISEFPSLKFKQPVVLAKIPQDDTKFLIAEKGGILFKLDSILKTADVVLDISDIVSSTVEDGLLNVIVHPSYPNIQLIFLFYTNKNLNQDILSSFAFNGNEIDKNSENIILKIPRFTTIHHGSAMAFDANNNLLVSIGDGGPAEDPNGRAQNTMSMQGTILRINTSNTPYSVPSDNPFINSPSFLPEIYAYGFRNPWRMSIDSLTNNLWVGDVGQDKFEEVNIVSSGQNYGWNIKEGNTCFNKRRNSKKCKSRKLRNPFYTYGRNIGGSITGGYVYRGTNIPMLYGQYIFADFVSGGLFALDSSRKKSDSATKLLDTGLFISSLSETNQGELFLVSYGDGNIYTVNWK